MRCQVRHRNKKSPESLSDSGLWCSRKWQVRSLQRILDPTRKVGKEETKGKLPVAHVVHYVRDFVHGKPGSVANEQKFRFGLLADRRSGKHVSAGNGHDLRDIGAAVLVHLGCGNPNRESRSHAHGALHADLALVPLNNIAAGSQADAGPPFAGFIRTTLGGVERIEDMRQLIGWGYPLRGHEPTGRPYLWPGRAITGG